MSRPLAVAFSLLLLLPALAQSAEPARAIELRVDATEAPRKLLHARMVIPARPGPLTLYYPKWIPGEHAPNGPITDLSGLKLTAGGKPLTWRRDDVDLFAFHCTVPKGADAVEVTLDYLGSGSKGGYSAGGSMTPRLAILTWHEILVYPKGQPVRDLSVRASLQLPPHWKGGTALPVESVRQNVMQFAPVSLETLVDSPVLCGLHFKEVPLGPAAGPPHFLVMACDSAAGLELSAALKTQYERLVVEAGALFGTRHYRTYRFLLALSDHIAHFAEEHHESSDNRMPERMLVDDSYRKTWANWVLPHEFVHSWNGKYRRPAGLATPDFQQPMKTDLLWVYEGLTEYLGFVLAGRSGLYTPARTRENLALIADWARNRRGRTWRPLEDTAVAAPHLYGARKDWANRRRGVDFYDEGALLWLDADTLIRTATGGKKSLDDFCRIFHGGKGGTPEVKPYTFDDVVTALNQVTAHDWKGFLTERLTATRAEPPMDGLKRGGWKVVYTGKRGEVLKAHEEVDEVIDLSASIGLLLNKEGHVIDVVPDKAADRARLGPGMKLLAVNGRRWDAQRLRQAVTATQGGKQALQLLLENDEYFTTFPLAYQDGARFPHLERDTSKPDLISAIFKAQGGKK